MHLGGSCVVCRCHSCLVLLDSMRCVESSLPINRCLGILNVLGETIMLKHQLSQPHILTEAEASSNLKTSFYKNPPIHISYLTAPLLRIECTRRDAGAGAGMERAGQDALLPVRLPLGGAPKASALHSLSCLLLERRRKRSFWQSATASQKPCPFSLFVRTQWKLLGRESGMQELKHTMAGTDYPAN